MRNIPAELRPVIDRLSESVCDGFERIVGRGVDVGVSTTWADGTLEARKLPIRAVVVRVDAPLRDCLIGIGAAYVDKLAPLMEAATTAMLDDLGLDVDAMRAGEATEYVNGDDASEQLDGIWGEVAVNYGLPIGDVVVVFGTGLLRSAHALIAGVPDVLPVLLDSLNEDSHDRYTFGDGQIGVEDDAELATDQAPHESDDELVTASVQHETDQELATDAVAMRDGADELAVDAVVQAAEAPLTVEAMNPVTAPAHVPVALPQIVAEPHPMAPVPVVAYEPAPMSSSTERWSNLLSGVHVEVTAELGRTDLPLGDIASLVADSVLSLDQMVDEPLTVYVNGTRFATARLVVVGDEYGIEILEVLEQADRGALLAA